MVFDNDHFTVLTVEDGIHYVRLDHLFMNAYAFGATKTATARPRPFCKHIKGS